MEELDRGLVRAGGALLDYIQLVDEGGESGDKSEETEEQQAEMDRERLLLRRVGEIWVHLVVPFLRRGLSEGVFGVPFEREAGMGEGLDGGLEGAMREWRDWLDRYEGEGEGRGAEEA